MKLKFMKIFFYLLYSLVCIIISFGYNNIKIKFWYIFLPIFIIIPLDFLFTFLLSIFKFQIKNTYDDISFSLIMGSGVITLVIWTTYTVPLMLDTLINFHKTYNAMNLNKFPISIFINYRDKIILGFKVIFCLGAFLMLYGIFF